MNLLNIIQIMQLYNNIKDTYHQFKDNKKTNNRPRHPMMQRPMQRPQNRPRGLWL